MAVAAARAVGDELFKRAFARLAGGRCIDGGRCGLLHWCGLLAAQHRYRNRRCRFGLPNHRHRLWLRHRGGLHCGVVLH